MKDNQQNIKNNQKRIKYNKENMEDNQKKKMKTLQKKVKNITRKKLYFNNTNQNRVFYEHFIIILTIQIKTLEVRKFIKIKHNNNIIVKDQALHIYSLLH